MTLNLGTAVDRPGEIEEFEVVNDKGSKVGSIWRRKGQRIWDWKLDLQFPEANSDEKAVQNMGKALEIYSAGMAALHAARFAGWGNADGPVDLDGFMEAATRLARKPPHKVL